MEKDVKSVEKGRQNYLEVLLVALTPHSPFISKEKTKD